MTKNVGDEMRPLMSLRKHVKKGKKGQGKERRTGCFQLKVTNYLSTKTRTKSKYHTSRGLKSYSLPFSFLGLRLCAAFSLRSPREKP